MYEHRDSPTCICRGCYFSSLKETAKEPHSKFPDCKHCYLYFNVLCNEFCEYTCNFHKTPEEMEEVRSTRQLKLPVKSEEVPSRWYFITYTEHESVKSPTRVLKSAARLIKSKAVAATQWAYSLELTQSGTPHVHIRLNTEKYPDYKKCIGAFNDGFRYDVQMEKGGAGSYIIKEESKPSAAWLAQWGLDSWFTKSANYSGELPPELISHL